MEMFENGTGQHHFSEVITGYSVQEGRGHPLFLRLLVRRFAVSDDI